MILRRSTLILFILGFLLESCTVKINDSEFCADLGALGATCFHLLSSTSRDIKKADWDKLRFGQICETTDVFANLKAAVESLCQNSGNCTFEQQQAASAFFAKVESVKSKTTRTK